MKKNLFFVFIICISIKSFFSRVILIGIDGFLQKCYSEAVHPTLDFIIANGASSFQARGPIQAASGPGWSNILCGMESELTGITSNDWKAPWITGKNEPITPISGNKNPMPCIFEELKKANPKTKTCAYYCWEWFTNLGNKGSPGSLDKEQLCPGTTLKEHIQCDLNTVQNVKENLQDEIDFSFVYFHSLDTAGHTYGFCSKEYIDRLSAIDVTLGKIIETLKEEGVLDSTHIIINTDHGATYLKPIHGEQNDDNLIIPWIIMGPGIRKNYKISTVVRNMDTAPTIAKIFGMNKNEFWRDSKVIEEVFEGAFEEQFNENLINFLN